MKLTDLLTPSFKAYSHSCCSLVDSCLASDSDFCQEVVSSGRLTMDQVSHAARRYQLGKSKSGRCIFWMIDEQGQVRDGHIGQSWVSVMLKARETKLLSHWHATHCLFGQHLVAQEEAVLQPVCIVEKESSAVILSELFPECIWLATVYPMNFSVYSFDCLQGHDVKLFPKTDETMDSYLAWCELADQARHRYQLHVEVQDILELHATAAQKTARIDLADYIFSN